MLVITALHSVINDPQPSDSCKAATSACFGTLGGLAGGDAGAAQVALHAGYVRWLTDAAYKY